MDGGQRSGRRCHDPTEKIKRLKKLFVQAYSKVDLELLAILNKQLIEDERHDNPMTADQLRARISEFIRTEYKAYFFMEEGEVRGYPLVNIAGSFFI